MNAPQLPRPFITLGTCLALGVSFARAQGPAPAQPATAAAAPANPLNNPAAAEERRRLGELAAADRRRMMELLNIPAPGPLPPPADDPQRPANTHPSPTPLQNWTDGVAGHTIVRSGWGKATIVAMAYEPRWAIGYSSCSGEGGTKLHRHDVGESVDNVCGVSEYHWMAGNFLKYAGHWDQLPIDQHELIALVAPRPIFVTGGTTDLWSDPVGEFKACVGAGPVYRLLGKKDVGQTAMPAPDAELISGDIGFRFHEGGHTDSLDWPVFIKFAEKYFAATTK